MRMTGTGHSAPACGRYPQVPEHQEAAGKPDGDAGDEEHVRIARGCCDFSSADRSYQNPCCLANRARSCYYRHADVWMATLISPKCRALCLAFALVAALAGCGVSDTRYYLGAFEQNQELRELFRLFNKEKDQENRFVLITQIAAGLANEGRVDREILFLTTHVEKNPADIYNGYYLLLVADAYRDMKAAPFAIHYYRRILSNYGDLLVKGTSIHLQCLQELLALETDPEAKIGYYKELFSRFPDQSPGDQLVLHGEELRGSGGVGAVHPGLPEVHRVGGRRRHRRLPGRCGTPRRRSTSTTARTRAGSCPDLNDLVAARQGRHHHEEHLAPQAVPGAGELLPGAVGPDPADQRRDRELQHHQLSPRVQRRHRIPSWTSRPTAARPRSARRDGTSGRRPGTCTSARSISPRIPTSTCSGNGQESTSAKSSDAPARAHSVRPLLAALLLAAPRAERVDGACRGRGTARPCALLENGSPDSGPDGPLPPLQGHEGARCSPSPFLTKMSLEGTWTACWPPAGTGCRPCWTGACRYRELILQRSRGAGAAARAGVPARAGVGVPGARRVSRAGPAGLWQLMRNTASPYGLRMDLWLDERRDVRKATEASLGKLAENYADLR